MPTKVKPADNRKRSSKSIFIVVSLCGFFYLLGLWQWSGSGKGDGIAIEVSKRIDCSVLSDLSYETPHDDDSEKAQVEEFKPCDSNYIDYTPCHDQTMAFPQEKMIHRERQCPALEEKLHCLIPAPRGYVTPYSWPKSRDYVPYANVPYKSLTHEKGVQDWVEYDGHVFRFNGGGTRFPKGVDAYIDELASVIPLDNGMIRTALDTGCGIASWGAHLFKKNVITMSIAPRDSHEAEGKFAMERGVPAIIGVLGTIKLPFPSGSFDMAHCSHCLIPWSKDDGMYMMEVDRVLRPGGYWVISGPPINWKNNYKEWLRPEEEVEEAQRKIEDIAKHLCWEKKYEKGDIAIWRKRFNTKECSDLDTQTAICESTNVDDVWYKKMEKCVTPARGGCSSWKPFPERLNAVPFGLSSGSVPGVSVEAYKEDNRLWKKHVNSYKRVNKIIDTGRYRNIMDMNSGLGSFAAALDSPKLWVMNVVPTISQKSTLGVIFNRGLIGIYHDWCESFSTYPRTYDLIHANGVFSLYNNVCSAEDILLEMDRILRPEGAVIFRDQESVLMKIKRSVRGMRWKTKMVDHEDDPLATEKVLFAVKQYWVAGDSNNITSSH